MAKFFKHQLRSDKEFADWALDSVEGLFPLAQGLAAVLCLGLGVLHPNGFAVGLLIFIATPIFFLTKIFRAKKAILANNKEAVGSKWFQSIPYDHHLHLSSGELKQISESIKSLNDPEIEMIWKDWLMQTDFPIRRADHRALLAWHQEKNKNVELSQEIKERHELSKMFSSPDENVIEIDGDNLDVDALSKNTCRKSAQS